MDALGIEADTGSPGGTLRVIRFANPMRSGPASGTHFAASPDPWSCVYDEKFVLSVWLLFRWLSLVRLDSSEYRSPNGSAGALKEKRPMSKLRKFFKSDRGATAIEYGLIAALISVVIIAALTLTGNSLRNVFNSVGSTLSSAAN
jgi:pilus assembly protein Flp/PilA